MPREVEMAKVLGTRQKYQVCTGLEFLFTSDDFIENAAVLTKEDMRISVLRSIWLQNNKLPKGFY